jgi:hypothetical protein
MVRQMAILEYGLVLDDLLVHCWWDGLHAKSSNCCLQQLQ